MKHFSYDEWQQYVKNEINEDTRIELEHHLYTCDQCLEHYLEAVAANESSLPTLSNENSFTARVMEMVPDTVRTLDTVGMVSSVPVTNSKLSMVENIPSVPDTQSNLNGRMPLYRRVGFHYLLAAAATLLLMFTGAFQSLTSYANSLEQQQMHMEEKKKPSVTEGVINKTFAWMDSLEKKEANKK